MSATNTTTNLGLSQFVNTDVPAWRQDYNGDMLKIDNAYTADISGATAETSADPSDYMKFYDVSATTNKKILISDLLKGAKVEDLTDTDITTPIDNDGLVYDATAQKWENKQITTKEQWQKNGAYNLCPNKGTTQIVQSVTVTVKADLTLSTSGTASANGYFDIFPKSTELFLEKGKTYKLIDGTENDATVVGVQIFFYDSTNTSLGFYGKGDIFTVPNNTYYIYVALRIQNTVNFSGKTFMPLITSDLNATAADYVPYAMTNRELTEKVVPILIPSSDFSVNANASIQTNWSAVCGNVCQICLQLTTSAQINAYTEILSMSKYIPFGAAGSYAPLQCIITKGDTVFVGYASYANNALSLKCQSVIPSGSIISINFTMIIK